MDSLEWPPEMELKLNITNLAKLRLGVTKHANCTRFKPEPEAMNYDLNQYLIGVIR